MSPARILIMAGGTGGHVYPALAVAECLRSGGARVDWLGSAQGPEAERVQGAGYAFHSIPVRGLRGNGLLGWFLAPARIAAALWVAAKVLRRVRPQVVLGMGGYVSGPGALAAWLLRCPLIIHEQNAIPGLTNRILSHLASQVLEAFSGSFPSTAGAVHTGNPVRGDIAALPAPEKRLAHRSGPLRLLVLGGSQGARFLNEQVPAALAELANPQGYEVRHQAGIRQLDAARAAYRARHLDVEPVAFIEAMAEHYAWADLVVCRAGAMTIAEVAAAGVASILVPLPQAVDDHQSANGRYLSEADAALLIPQAQLTPGRLARLLEDFSQARDRLLAMALRARELALMDADQKVAEACLKWAGISAPRPELPHV